MVEYREWSLRLAHPALLPMARRVCAFISENRLPISRWLFQTDPAVVNTWLQAKPAPHCENGPCSPAAARLYGERWTSAKKRPSGRRVLLPYMDE